MDCGAPPMLNMCTVSNPSTACNSVATYTPINGFVVNGDETLVCAENGQWEQDVGQPFPVCVDGKGMIIDTIHSKIILCI